MAPLGRTSPATRVLLRVLAALMVAAALLLVHATTAQAAPPDPAGAAYSARCATTDASAAARVAGDDLLPVNRWSPATNNFHSRTDGVLGALNAVQRDVGAGMFMSIGNGLWAVTSDITLFAARFCILDTAGTAVDATAGDLMKSLVSGGLAPYLVALIVGAFGFGIWNGYRRRGAVDWKQMGLKAGAVALLITLMTGAQATNPDRGTFGAGSPGWWVTTANDTISDIGSAPALFTAQAETDGDQSDPLSCEAYVTELKQAYQQRYRSSLTSSAASMPIVLNSIWEQTGMEAWKTAQFGQSEYADRVFCRLMDQFADVPVGVWPIDDGNLQQDAAQQRAAKWYQDNGRSTVLAIMSRIPGVPEVPYPNSIAFTPVNDITRDVSVVGWAVCDYDSGRWRYANDSLVANDIPADHAGTSKDDGSIYPNQNAGGQGCAGWWSERAVAGSGGFNDGRSAFDWEANPEKIYNELSGPEQDFMLTLHSYKAGSSVAVAFWYAVSALFMFAVFGLVSMGIVLAKFAMVVMMIGIVGVIVSALLPRAGASDRLGGFAKTALGLMLLTTMTMAVFSVLGQLTKLSMDAGLRVFEPGTIGAMFWAAASPVIAVFSMHWLFKKMNVTSPFTVQGVKAWGGAAPAIGGAVGGAVGAGVLSRLGNRVKNEATQRASSAVLGKVTGGRLNGTHGQRKGDTLTRKVKPQSAHTDQRHVGTPSKLSDAAAPAGGKDTTPNGALDAALGGDGVGPAAPGSGEPGFDATTGAVTGALTSPGEAGVAEEHPKSLRMARTEREDALLAANKDAILARFGKDSLDDLTRRERTQWLREHRATQVSRARALTQQEWDARNAGTWRAMVHQRQRDAQDEYGDISLRQYVGAVAGATKDRAAVSLGAARAAYRTGGVAGVARKAGADAARVGANAAKNIKPAALRGAKVAGKAAAVGAIAFTGIATGPVGMAVAGGVLAHRARKGWTAAADRRGARRDEMLTRLAAHDKARAQERAAAAAEAASGAAPGGAAPADAGAGMEGTR